MIKNLVTIYITNFNYANYIEKAIKSCLNQTYKKIEIIIFDDGSTDKSKEIINNYSKNEKITAVYQKKLGLVKTCNKALYSSKGEFIVRLDADDWLDENAIYLMVNKLKKNTKSNFIFADYYEVDEHGLIKNLIRRHDFKNVKLLDQFAHGACTLFRVSSLKKIGGYDEIFTCQDGVNIWLKFLQKNKAININLPLFFYRKHGKSLTTNYDKIAINRNKILNYRNKSNKKKQHIVGVIFVRGRKYDKYTNIFEKIGNSSLLDISINRLLSIKKLKKVIVSSPDSELKSFLKKSNRVLFNQRPAELANPGISISESLKFFVNDYFKKYKKRINTLVVCKINSPFLDYTHIENAINTLDIFKLDAVIGVKSRDENLFRHNGKTLSPLRYNDCKYEKETGIRLIIEAQQIYSNAGNFIVIKRNKINEIDNLKKLKIGHEILSELSSYEIKNDFNLKVAKIMHNNIKNLTDV